MWYSIGCLVAVGAAVDGITAAAAIKNDTTDSTAKSFLIKIVTLFASSTPQYDNICGN